VGLTAPAGERKRIDKMKMEEMKKQLREIAEIAKKQREGAYTPQSDAMMALQLVEQLVQLLNEVLTEK
jgi:hypothetical protein